MNLEMMDGKIKLLDLKRVHILIIGAGGTGSYVIAHLGRFLAYLEKIRPDMKVSITIADGDRFEEKNKERQVCYNADIDKNKARVQAKKLTNQFGLLCLYHDSYVEDVTKCIYLATPHEGPTGALSVMIGCVDNNGTRQIMDLAFRQYKGNMVYIDSGNNDAAGQIALALKYRGEPVLPPVGYYHPDIIKDRESPVPSQMSCAQRMLETPQAMMANVWAATVVMSMLTNLLENNEIDTVLSYFHSVRVSVKPHVTTEKFYSHNKASIYFHNKIKNKFKGHFWMNGWSATPEINLYGLDPQFDVAKDLYGDPASITMTTADNGLKFTLVGTTNSGEDLKLIPYLGDGKEYWQGEPIEVDYSWASGPNPREIADYISLLMKQAAAAYYEPGKRTDNVLRALAGLHAKPQIKTIGKY